MLNKGTYAIDVPDPAKRKQWGQGMKDQESGRPSYIESKLWM